MSYAQWTHAAANASGTNLEAVLDTTSAKIVGNSSLQYRIPSGTVTCTRGCMISGWTAGVGSTDIGQVQTLFNFNSAGGSNEGWGTCWSEIQGSIAPTNTMYIAVWDPAGGGVYLLKTNLKNLANIGVAGAGAFTLATAAAPSYSQSSTYALEFKWQYTTNPAQQTLIIGTDGPVSSPSTYDYSTITKRLTYVDTSPLTGGVSAGIGMFQNAVADTSSGSAKPLMDYDTTQIYYP